MAIWHDKMDFRNMLWDFIDPLTVADLVGSIGMSEERAQEVINSQDLDADMGIDEAKDMLREIVGQRSAEELASISGMEEDDMQMLIDLVSGTRKLSNTMTISSRIKNVAHVLATVRTSNTKVSEFANKPENSKLLSLFQNSAELTNAGKVLWSLTHKDYRGKLGGSKSVMCLGPDGGSQLWPLDSVTPEEMVWLVRKSSAGSKALKSLPVEKDAVVRTAAEVTHELRVCGECLLFIANGDLPEDPEREEEIVAGVESFAPGHVVAGDSDNDDEFSRRPCDCCGTTLAGSRHDAAVLDG